MARTVSGEACRPASEAERTAFEQLVRSGLFSSVRATLTNEDGADDRLQEGVAWAWREFVRHGAEGKSQDPALLKHICRLRAQDLGRQLVTDGTHRYRDAFDRRAYRDGLVTVERLHSPIDDADDDSGDTLIEASLAAQHDPEDWMNSHVDLETWWRRHLNEDERQLIKARWEGYSLSEIAAEFGKDISTACRRIRNIGRDLAKRAGLPVGA